MKYTDLEEGDELVCIKELVHPKLKSKYSAKIGTKCIVKNRELHSDTERLFDLDSIAGMYLINTEYFHKITKNVPPIISQDLVLRGTMTKKECTHQWEVVGMGLFGNDYINCKHCGIAKEKVDAQYSVDSFAGRMR